MSETVAYHAAGFGQKAKLIRRAKRSLDAAMAGAGAGAGRTVAVTTDVKLARINRKSGKSIPKRQRLLKLLEATCQPHIERYQFLQKLDATYGLTPLNYQQVAVSGVNTYPVYAFDLTSSFNVINERGDRYGLTNQNMRYPAVLYRLCRNYNSGATDDLLNNYFWKPTAECVARLPDGATSTYTWCNERVPRRGLAPLAATHFDWFDIRMMLYAPTGRTVNVYVDLVQMTDDKFIDYWTLADSDNGTITGAPNSLEQPYITGSSDRAREWNELWGGFVDRLVTNPLNKRDAYNVKGLKTVYSDVIKFNPRQTDNADTRGDMRMYKLFKRINRIVRYQWEKTGIWSKAGNGITGPTGVAANAEDNPNVWDSNLPAPGDAMTATSYVDTDCQVAPAPKSRLYLMVYAESPVTGAFAPADHASFDFCIRRKRSVVGSI